MLYQLSYTPKPAEARWRAPTSANAECAGDGKPPARTALAERGDVPAAARGRNGVMSAVGRDRR